MSHVIFITKQNDTTPLEMQLKDADGPVDITGATVKFLMRDEDNTVVVDSTANIDDASEGKVSYDFAAADTANVGEYEAEWEVTFSDGTVTTFPSDTYIVIDIVDDIA